MSAGETRSIWVHGPTWVAGPTVCQAPRIGWRQDGRAIGFRGSNPMDIGRLFSFDGRINRLTYWGITIVGYIVFLIGVALVSGAGSSGLAIAVAFALLAVWFVVALATQTKRWHDRDKSGWWALIAFVPFIGGLW